MTSEGAEDVFEFALQLAHQFDLLEDQRVNDWGTWCKEQYRLTDRNRATIKAIIRRLDRLDKIDPA